MTLESSRFVPVTPTVPRHRAGECPGRWPRAVRRRCCHDLRCPGDGADANRADRTGNLRSPSAAPVSVAARVRRPSRVFGALAFALVVEARRSKVTDEVDLVEAAAFPSSVR